MNHKDEMRKLTGCDGKKPYKSRNEARDALWAERRRFPKLAFSVYKCQTCKLWHLGHDRKFRNTNVNKNKKLMRKHTKAKL